MLGTNRRNVHTVRQFIKITNIDFTTVLKIVAQSNMCQQLNAEIKIYDKAFQTEKDNLHYKNNLSKI